MSRQDVTGEDVLVMYCNERNKIREYHGMTPISPEAFRARAKNLWGPACEKAAALCNKHNIDAVMWVEACFEYARSMKHPDGPQANCLGSESYGLKALARKLNIPVEVVIHECAIDTLVKKRQEAYIRNVKFLRDTTGIKTGMIRNALLMSTITSIPASDRLVASAMDPELAEMIMQEVITEVLNDRITAAWLESIGWTLEKLEQYGAN